MKKRTYDEGVQRGLAIAEEHKRYNGWTNYETWCVALWFGNDAPEQSFWEEQARDAWESSETEATFTRAERAILTLADSMKEHVEEYAGPVTEKATMLSDLMSAALSEVNWYEIAQHYVQDGIDNGDFTFEEDSDGYDALMERPDHVLAAVAEHLKPSEWRREPYRAALRDIFAARHALQNTDEGSGANVQKN